jgi:hypothetical protein
MKKPSWFRWYDFLSFGGLALVGLAAVIYASIAGIQSPHAKQGMILLIVVTLTFAGIYLRYALLRKKEFDSFSWYPTYGFMVKAVGDYKLPTPDILDAAVRRTITAWTPYHPAETILKASANWCWFKKDLNTSTDEIGMLCKGYTAPNSHEIKVDYDTPTDALEITAFEHELGHVIRGNATGNWDGGEHHQFMKDHGLK